MSTVPSQRPSRLEILRAKRGMTQEQLSDASGVSRDVITAIENRRERRKIRVLTLVRLADALKVDLEELLEPEEATA